VKTGSLRLCWNLRKNDATAILERMLHDALSNHPITRGDGDVEMAIMSERGSHSIAPRRARPGSTKFSLGWTLCVEK
jgi:hypothetical protein